MYAAESQKVMTRFGFATGHFALCLLTVMAATSFGCSRASKSPTRQPREKAVIEVHNTANDDRRGDVVFVHGLDGNAVGTWTCEATAFYWPEVLGKQISDVGVWAVNYDAHGSDWLGTTMPIEDRSKNLLEQLRLAGIGERPIVFVAHSLGGIVVKQMLRDAFTMENEDWVDIRDRTRAVVFLGTPNSGSDVSNVVDFFGRLAPALRLNVTQDQLRKNAPILRDLNIWYRNNVVEREIRTKVFYENPIGGLAPVVDEASSDPGISGVTPIRADGDHFSICKPCSTDDLVYKSVADFIDTQAIPIPAKWDISIANCITEFNRIRHDDQKLAEFKSNHVNQEVTWNAVVRRVVPDKKSPSYAIASSEDSPATDFVIASFYPRKFDPLMKAGEHIQISGVIKDKTNELGIILHQCDIAKQ